MKITQADYVASAVHPPQYPKGNLPEVAFVGRSNVGKSSLINMLCGRKALAHVSSTPGKTATLNFFRLNERLMLVDLPGYGYAKVSKGTKEQWRKMIEGYLTERPSLKAVVLIVDLRHAPSAEDVMMYEWLKAVGLPVVIAATKADKLKRGEWERQLRQVNEVLGLADHPEDVVIPVSAETRLNRDVIWNLVAERLVESGEG